jgi:hypothetical protein
VIRIGTLFHRGCARKENLMPLQSLIPFLEVFT